MYVASEIKDEDLPRAFKMASTRPFELLSDVPEAVADAILQRFPGDSMGDAIGYVGGKKLHVHYLGFRSHSMSAEDKAAYDELLRAPAEYGRSQYSTTVRCTWTEDECCSTAEALGVSLRVLGDAWHALAVRKALGETLEITITDEEKEKCKRFETLGGAKIFEGLEVRACEPLGADSSFAGVTLAVRLGS